MSIELEQEVTIKRSRIVSYQEIEELAKDVEVRAIMMLERLPPIAKLAAPVMVNEAEALIKQIQQLNRLIDLIAEQL